MARGTINLPEKFSVRAVRAARRILLRNVPGDSATALNPMLFAHHGLPPLHSSPKPKQVTTQNSPQTNDERVKWPVRGAACCGRKKKD